MFGFLFLADIGVKTRIIVLCVLAINVSLSQTPIPISVYLHEQITHTYT